MPKTALRTALTETREAKNTIKINALSWTQRSNNPPFNPTIRNTKNDKSNSMGLSNSPTIHSQA
jgi:hypothetical protein